MHEPCPIFTPAPSPVSQVAALNPDGSLYFNSVTGGGGVWSWSSVTVVGAGFTTTVLRRVTWAGEGSRHCGVHVGCDRAMKGIEEEGH